MADTPLGDKPRADFRRNPWTGLAVMMTVALPAGWLAACSTKEPPPPPAPMRPAAPAAAPRPAPSPNAARSWDEYRLRAAQKLVSANPAITYTGSVPEPLLAIPVLSVELNGDGSISKIEVMRYPSQAKDTTQIAIDAVRRAAPFGDVSRLPKPWKYVETFLFDESRKFKPVTLDR
ncbi:MAG TPA: hypothetical protein VFY73_09730 [Ideonella sp.]|uniref:hypothetical protein n=1 Tax=Ideonella sp. TaxID=1929293 RepID=UPI002E34CDCA|nr:hypothetical protein [Ideonella sp.]HEX5684303.1 hypothetical protein [Ideonella sp.]